MSGLGKVETRGEIGGEGFSTIVSSPCSVEPAVSFRLFNALLRDVAPVLYLVDAFREASFVRTVLPHDECAYSIDLFLSPVAAVIFCCFSLNRLAPSMLVERSWRSPPLRGVYSCFY